MFEKQRSSICDYGVRVGRESLESPAQGYRRPTTHRRSPRTDNQEIGHGRKRAGVVTWAAGTWQHAIASGWGLKLSSCLTAFVGAARCSSCAPGPRRNIDLV